jgi:hypothetical protein
LNEVFSLAIATALLVLFQLSGLLALFELSHPWWESRANLAGGVIGFSIATVLFWLEMSWMQLTSRLFVVLMMLFPLCLVVTAYFAQKFINAADFEPLAGQIWHKGYITTIALFVPVTAFIVRWLISSQQK